MSDETPPTVDPIVTSSAPQLDPVEVIQDAQQVIEIVEKTIEDPTSLTKNSIKVVTSAVVTAVAFLGATFGHPVDQTLTIHIDTVVETLLFALALGSGIWYHLKTAKAAQAAIKNTKTN